MEDLTPLLSLPKEQPTQRSLHLWPGKAPGCADDFRPWLDPYPVKSGKPQGCVLICPGGGYASRMPHEGWMMAERFNRHGMHAFVVHYRVAPEHSHPEPLMDVSRAIRLVRSRAAEWNVLPDKIAVCGFSAGGHAAASSGVLWYKYPFRREDDLCKVSNRPDAIIPCYAVIGSAPKFGHEGSFKNLLGSRYGDKKLMRELSLERSVTAKAPPAFIWQTSDDSPVNGMALAEAYRKKNVPFELHIHMGGQHGLAVTDHPRFSLWVPMCCQWLKEMGW